MEGDLGFDGFAAQLTGVQPPMWIDKLGQLHRDHLRVSPPVGPPNPEVSGLLFST